jgi:hypothetical protein
MDSVREQKHVNISSKRGEKENGRKRRRRE